MAALRQQESVAARAVEFAILTAARSGEVRGAIWAEIDLDVALWVIPQNRMKAQKEHHVPLSMAASALLKTIPRLDDFVFAGRQHGKALSDMSLTAVLTAHGEAEYYSAWLPFYLSRLVLRVSCQFLSARSL